MRLYKDFYLNWLHTASLIHVKYEDVLCSEGRHHFFEIINDRFHSGEIPARIRVPRKVPFTQKDLMGSLHNYKMAHAPLLTPEDIRLINKTLRADVFQRLGYVRTKL